MIALDASMMGQKTGVFGLGKSGEATVAALLTAGAHVFAWDDSAASRDALARAMHGPLQIAPLEEWPWQELASLVLSPGVPLTHPKPHAVVEMAKKHDCPVVGDIELLYQSCSDATYVAVTGTNGKSTTTTLIGHILQHCGVKAEVGGNLGTAALSLAPLGEDGVYVLETSSYQLDLLQTVRFNVAVWLNITPDHLDRHGDMEGYIAAKKRIFMNQQRGDTAVVAVDDEYSKGIRDWVLGIGAQHVISVSSQHILSDGVYVKDGFLHDNSAPIPNPQSPIPIGNIVTLTGRHNWQNAAAAYAACRALGLAPEKIHEAMKSFPGLRHRLQLVTAIHGVRFVNDSKATNADATSHALAAYDTIYWIAGGRPKAGGIDSLEKYFSRVHQAFLIGEAEESFAASLKGKVSHTRCGTLASALDKAAAMAFSEKKKGAVVLLSPACASFDQFKNFEERGDVFCALVEKLAAKGAAA